MKRNIMKMMIFLVATALLCFGTTLTASASTDGADEGGIELVDDTMDNLADEVIEEIEEGDDDVIISDDMTDEQDEEEVVPAEEDEEEEDE